jgi:ribonucleoside-diphosphate reductase alpha chain
MIQHVVKRNGDVVQFSAQKIADAIDRCYSAAGLVAPQQAWSMVVALLEGRFIGDSPTVEQVQNAVEGVLLSLGERNAAKRYMAYRDERANARRMSAVTPHMRSVYEAGAASMGGSPLRVFQYFDKYARHRDDLEGGPRRETWPECVDRAMDHLRWLVIRECGEDKITPEEWDFLRQSVVDCDSMPSMRLLSQAGAAARRDDVAIFNCSYQAITDLLCFKESLLISMAGAGDAYSVEQKFITNLPFVRHQRGGKPDTPGVQQPRGDRPALHVRELREVDERLHPQQPGHPIRLLLGLLRGRQRHVPGAPADRPGRLVAVFAARSVP